MKLLELVRLPFVGATSYRRLLVFVVATGLILRGLIDQDAWLLVALTFAGTEGARRVIEAARRTPASPETS